jgi:hypothetical protein
MLLRTNGRYRLLRNFPSDKREGTLCECLWCVRFNSLFLGCTMVSALRCLLCSLLLVLVGRTDALLLPFSRPGSGLASITAGRAPIAHVRAQIAAPVKPPEPVLAPTKPSSDKANEKAKKYKVLLFNDNVNRCALASLPLPAMLVPTNLWSLLRAGGNMSPVCWSVAYQGFRKQMHTLSCRRRTSRGWPWWVSGSLKWPRHIATSSRQAASYLRCLKRTTDRLARVD